MQAISITQQSRDQNGKGAPQKSDGHGFRLGHRRNLDGLRGVAVLMVVFSHLQFLSIPWGFMGVQIFFVLSGFLITSLLTEEWDRTEKINLRAFYLRRALRLLPALYVMLALLLTYCALFHSPTIFDLDWKSVRAAFFYYANWMQAYRHMTGPFGHLWSLSIEEQFYFAWPIILLAILEWCPRKSVPNIILAGAAASCFTRIFLYEGTSAWPIRLQLGLDTRADALLLGCAASFFLSTGQISGSPPFAKGLKAGSFISVIGLWCLSRFSVWDYDLMIPYGWLLMSIFVGVIILQLMVVPGKLSRRLLENSPIVYVGKISYGLYIWHVPILIVLREHLPFDWKCKILVVFFSAIATLCSYYVIERPFLRLKKRFQISA